MSLCLCVSSVLLWCQQALAFSFSVEPSRIELSIPAGKQRGKTVRINNRSDKPIHIKAYVNDVIFLPDGTNDFPEPGSTAWSAAKWVKVIPSEFDIPAGGVQEARVSVQLPEGASGGYYAMVFFETLPTYTEKGLGVNFRIGALTQITVPKTEVYQAKIANLRVLSASSALVELFNDSNVLIRPSGRIKILDAREKRIAQVEFNPQRLGVLPKSVRQFSVELEPLPPGTYRLRAEIDYGTRYLLVGEQTFDVR
ncbi:MAG: hypothetical protein COV75_04375 [Candidatus Omnitrophica bacterium CG11_big_fil_rev_8_21_14_0_20_63_9]|nr:MAG: hypothetical protein COV75_04375 [Candidatus Omnitrophica bacterium CG11_big_fil_rev_8_21_14_0_20_63_9]